MTSLLPQKKRILSLDILRGVAVLGILIMNIQSFSMVSAAYLNPTAFGDLHGMNKWVWILSHALADQKFLSIFSMLFGVGVILFCDSIERKGYRPVRFYYRRLFWLFTIGLIHGYLFWQGDILVAYAICGSLVFIFRKVSPITLVVLGVIILAIPSFNYWLFGKSMEMWPPEAIENLKMTWAPGAEAIASEIESLIGGFGAQLQWRIPETFKMETFIFLILLGWRSLGMMMVGMALFKWGMFSVGWSKRSYAYIALAAFIVGFTLISIGVNKNFAAGWSVEYSMFFGWQWNYIGSIFVAIGYVAIVMLLTRYFRMGLLANVGKMALTNYLMMTLVCSIIFYGLGFGLFGSVDRTGQISIVIAIWILLLFFSWLWLRYFYMGPVEWLWRYLTYGNKPDFKK